MARSDKLGYIFLGIFFILIQCQGHIPEEAEERDGKVLSLFNIVRFKNEACTSGERNGTCYTAAECASRGGMAGNSCASGYGVCCVFTLSCGQRSSENCTYLVQGSAGAMNCQYTICRCDANVCRLRFDFTSLVLAPPQGIVPLSGGSIGDCLTDTFSITGRNGGSPVICGTNTGQHMIVNAQDACNTVNIGIGGGTPFSRMWNIKVTQYLCGDDLSRGGPTECLQYFTSPTGTISNFNFPTNADNLMTAMPIHLSNQDYKLCIRRMPGMCKICYFPSVSGGLVTSFGLSVSNGIKVGTVTNTNCKSDFLQIPNGLKNTVTDINALGAVDKICGRIFSEKNNQKTSATVCSFTQPFMVRFFTDEDEVLGAPISPMSNELKQNPNGLVGFSLDYKQFPCP